MVLRSAFWRLSPFSYWRPPCLSLILFVVHMVSSNWGWLRAERLMVVVDGIVVKARLVTVLSPVLVIGHWRFVSFKMGRWWYSCVVGLLLVGCLYLWVLVPIKKICLLLAHQSFPFHFWSLLLSKLKCKIHIFE